MDGTPNGMRSEVRTKGCSSKGGRWNTLTSPDTTVTGIQKQEVCRKWTHELGKLCTASGYMSSLFHFDLWISLTRAKDHKHGSYSDTLASSEYILYLFRPRFLLHFPLCISIHARQKQVSVYENV